MPAEKNDGAEICLRRSTMVSSPPINPVHPKTQGCAIDSRSLTISKHTFFSIVLHRHRLRSSIPTVVRLKVGSPGSCFLVCLFFVMGLVWLFMAVSAIDI
jgi:hypothetical protein